MFDPADLPEALREELAGSQRLGLIGQRSLGDHIQHAIGFANAGGVLPRKATDLGPGGGVPAMVLAAIYPESEWTLIEARQRTVARLDVMIARLNWGKRVQTRWGPAEEAGRDPSLRTSFDVVTARGFGPPAMVAECAAPLLTIGGRLIVSEPPAGPQRWPRDQLSRLGLTEIETSPGYFVAELTEACPDEHPRRAGKPRRRPLW